ncbi:MAG TPA: lamin tail domain-containing protein, partial [Clostridia bacterium]|nr:lamin tail domain-containing protein [Clostridia bacterium]
VQSLPTLIDAKYQAFTRNGIQASSPASILTYLSSRRTYVNAQLKKYDAPFTVSTNLIFTTNEYATITGTASYRVKSIRIDSGEFPITWITLSNWSASIQLTGATNHLQVVGYGTDKMPLEGMAADVVIVATASQVIGEPLLVINEWMADNTRTVADPADGRYDDWFELYNPNAFAVDLLGYRISDDTNNPSKFTFSAGTAIPAHGHLLVWADEESYQSAKTGQVHVNFKLARTGEVLALYGPSGKLLDMVRFGLQQPDVSEGRVTDGTQGTTKPFSTPSPGTANQPVIPAPQILLQCRRATPSQLILSWNGMAGKTYQLESATNLSQAIWSAGERITVQSSQGEFNVPITGAGQIFYRIKDSQ